MPVMDQLSLDDDVVQSAADVTRFLLGDDVDVGEVATAILAHPALAAEIAARLVPDVASAPARPTDPSTSHASARSHSTNELRRFRATSQAGRLLTLFAERAHNRLAGMTDQQAARWLHGGKGRPLTVSQIEGTRRRCSDLRALGLLQDSGRRAFNPGSHDESIVWEISPLGEQVARRLAATGWST